MTRTVDADYLVIGAGAAGMAFTDALIDHCDARVAMVDRRDGPGGHWRAAYPFVRLHQASCFYGVASTLLGGGRIQTEGPEAGLHERADQPEILCYYDDVLAERMVGPGRVEVFTGCDYLGDRTFVSLETGERYDVPPHCRVVDARYLAPDIPAESPRRFAVDGARVVPVNDLPSVDDGPSQYVIVGSGKTATDAVVWLLGQGTDPDAICWVRPREPWMLNRALIQPDPVVFLGMTADLMEACAAATSLDDVFLRLEAAGIMMRINPKFTPTMARAPTLGRWELDLLRSVTNVVRNRHIRVAHRGRLDLDGGSVAIADDALVVDCAADGLKVRPLVPIWGEDAITVQPVRAGFPVFGAALVGYVEATRTDDAEKNRLCPPSPLSSTREDWARMTVIGARNAASFGAEPDITAWTETVPLNPVRVPPEHPGGPALDAVRERLASSTPIGIAALAGMTG